MKAISFSEMKILPALLDRTKCQTIRPAWNDKGPREARFKVGDNVKFFWKQRVAAKFFCSVCGKPNDLEIPHLGCIVGGKEKGFKKILGGGVITEVFKIEMCVSNGASLITGYDLKTTCALAKKDGFKAGKTGKYTGFYNFFHKNYDLWTPKEFWVYRWRWIGVRSKSK